MRAAALAAAAWLVVVLVPAAHGSGVTPSSASRFVRAEGLRFVRGNATCSEPVAVSGANSYLLVEMAAEVRRGSFGADWSRGRGHAEVRRTLDQLKARGQTLVRLWAFTLLPDKPLRWGPGPADVDEQVFRGLDFIVAEAEKRGLYILPVLGDYWQYVGGVQQFVGWSQSASTSDDFFRDPEVVAMYEAHVASVVHRRNVYTDVAYRDSPSIFAWELLNEPRVRNQPEVLQAWIDRLARFIKSQDPLHMVTVGEEGFVSGPDCGAHCSVVDALGSWTLQTGQDFVANHAGPDIDFAAIHVWVDDWSLLSLGRITRSQRAQDAFINSWLDAHEHDARVLLKKPLLLEEYGKRRANSALDRLTGRSARARMALYESVHRFVLSRAARARNALQGACLWVWMPESLRPRDSWEDDQELYAVYPSEPVAWEAQRFARRLDAAVPGTGSCAQ